MDSLQSQLEKTLGDSYAIERELSGGGMARVFVARERTLDRRVVIKTLAPDIGSAISAERFRREIRLAASLQQANIVPVHTTGEIDGVPYYTMPYVEGESLRSRLLEGNPLPVPEAVNILRDVARALAFAHERGVVHRDIKPENILLSGDTAVVTDFGIAKAIEASQSQTDRLTLTNLGLVLGTPAYLSPEQAAGDARVDQRADVYALGVVAYELFAGSPPFTGKTAQGLMAAHIAETPTPLGERNLAVPPRVAQLVMRCLEKDPARRPATATELLRALDAAAMEPHPSGGNTVARPSIAVLPFANLSPDPENEFFAHGITDDLIAQVAKISSLRVIARTSVMKFRDMQGAAHQAARELGVAAVVEGTVRRAGKRARIVAQLIDAASDATIWSETYDRDLDDVFSVQTEVAMSVAGALRAALTPAEERRLGRVPTRDAKAYDLYLLGRQHFSRRTPESLRASISHFERAIERDPKFAGAYAGLADAYVFAGLGYAPIPVLESFAKAKEAAARAVALDDSSPDALCADGISAMHGDWDVTRARAAFERALTVSPSHAAAHEMLGWCTFAVGEYAAAIGPLRRARELDPLNVSLIVEEAWPYMYAELYDVAIPYFRRAIEIDPGFGLGYYNLGRALEGLGQYREALDTFHRAIECMGPTPWVLASVATASNALGDSAKSDQVLATLSEQGRAGVAVWLSIAMVLDALGRGEEAADALERSIDAHEPFVWGLGLEAWLSFPNARRLARFRAILDRLGAKPHDIAGQRQLLLARMSETVAPGIATAVARR